MLKDYNIDVQIVFLRMMITNAELFTRVLNIINPDNFDRKLRPAVSFLIDHSKNYNVLPEPVQIKGM